MPRFEETWNKQELLVSKLPMSSYWLLAPVSALVAISLWFTHGPTENLVDDIEFDRVTEQEAAASLTDLANIRPSLPYELALHGESISICFPGELTIELNVDETWVGSLLAHTRYQIGHINGKRDWPSIRSAVDQLRRPSDRRRELTNATITAHDDVIAGEIFTLVKILESLELTAQIGSPDWASLNFDEVPNKLSEFHSLREFGRTGVAVLVEDDHALIADPYHIERIRLTRNIRRNDQRIEASLKRFRKRASETSYRFDVLTMFRDRDREREWEWGSQVDDNERAIARIATAQGLNRRNYMFRYDNAAEKMRAHWDRANRVAAR